MTGTATSLTDLYRQTVLSHSRHPHNCRRPQVYDREAEGHNALCGDKIHVYLRLQDDALADVAWEASGCAISLASASMMSDAVTGRTVAATRQTIDDFMTGLSGPQARETGRRTRRPRRRARLSVENPLRDPALAGTARST